MANTKISDLPSASDPLAAVLAGAEGGASVGVLASLLAMLPLGVQKITATGTYTPTAGTKKAILIGIGSGAGAGGVGSSAAGAGTRCGGGRGGCGEGRIAIVDIDTSLTYTATIGNAGTGGAAGNNAGTAGGDVSLNDGTSNILVCKGGAQGSGSPGNSNGASGANGSGGTGGVLWGEAQSRSAFSNESSSLMGAFNPMFGSGLEALAGVFDLSGGTAALALTGTGLQGVGPGSGGTGGWHFGAATNQLAGGAGSKGVLYIIEFGGA